MGLIHIMKRGGEDVQRFEDAIYEAKEAISEICEFYEEMKSQFGEGEESEVLKALRPLMAERPRGQQISGVRFVSDALPRTATGKIKRWELQQKVGTWI